MKLGLVGLGKMGLNLGRNLIDHKHEVVAFDLNAEAVNEMKEYGAEGVSSYAEMVLRSNPHVYCGSWFPTT